MGSDQINLMISHDAGLTFGNTATSNQTSFGGPALTGRQGRLDGTNKDHNLNGACSRDGQLRGRLWRAHLACLRVQVSKLQGGAGCGDAPTASPWRHRHVARNLGRGRRRLG